MLHDKIYHLPILTFNIILTAGSSSNPSESFTTKMISMVFPINAGKTSEVVPNYLWSGSTEVIHNVGHIKPINLFSQRLAKSGDSNYVITTWPEWEHVKGFYILNSVLMNTNVHVIFTILAVIMYDEHKDIISLSSKTQNQVPYTYAPFSSWHLIKHCVNQQGHTLISILISMHAPWVVLLSFSHTQPVVQLYIAPSYV